MVLLGTHNICFGWEIWKIFFNTLQLTLIKGTAQDYGTNFCLFVLLLYVPVNSYAGHVGTVSSPNHTFFLGMLINQYFVQILSLVTDTNPFWINQLKGRDHRNYFMINLHKSMGPGRDRTHDPWISSQTSICSQTLYPLHYAARYMVLIALVKMSHVHVYNNGNYLVTHKGN